MHLPAIDLSRYMLLCKEAGEKARSLARDSDDVLAGHFYTVSPSFETGDESWCEDFWEVLSINGSNALVRTHGADGDSTISLFSNKRACLVYCR